MDGQKNEDKCPQWFSAMMNMASKDSQTSFPSAMMPPFFQIKPGGTAAPDKRDIPKHSESGTSSSNGNSHCGSQDNDKVITNGNTETPKSGDDDNAHYWMWQAYQAFSQWQFCIQKVNEYSNVESNQQKPQPNSAKVDESLPQVNAFETSSTTDPCHTNNEETATILSENEEQVTDREKPHAEKLDIDSLARNDVSLYDIGKESQISSDNTDADDKSMDISEEESENDQQCSELNGMEKALSEENDQLWLTVFEGISDSPQNAELDNDIDEFLNLVDDPSPKVVEAETNQSIRASLFDSMKKIGVELSSDGKAFGIQKPNFNVSDNSQLLTSATASNDEIVNQHISNSEISLNSQITSSYDGPFDSQLPISLTSSVEPPSSTLNEGKVVPPASNSTDALIVPPASISADMHIGQISKSTDVLVGSSHTYDASTVPQLSHSNDAYVSTQISGSNEAHAPSIANDIATSGQQMCVNSTPHNPSASAYPSNSTWPNTAPFTGVTHQLNVPPPLFLPPPSYPPPPAANYFAPPQVPPPGLSAPPPPYTPYGMPSMQVPMCSTSAYHSHLSIPPPVFPPVHMAPSSVQSDVPNAEYQYYSSAGGVNTMSMTSLSQSFPTQVQFQSVNASTTTQNSSYSFSTSNEKASSSERSRKFAAGGSSTQSPRRNLAKQKFLSSDEKRQPRRDQSENSFSTPPSDIITSQSPEYFYKDEISGNMIGKPALVALEDEFFEKIISRRPTACEGRVPWKPMDRTDYEHRCTGHDHSKCSGSGSSNSSSSDDSDDSSESSEMSDKKRKTKNKKDASKCEAEPPKDNIDVKKKKKLIATDKKVKGIERFVLRTDRHRREVAHKMSHPYKLHPELWYNEHGELNDGPACACKKRHQIGPLHNKYEGEEEIPLCNPESNNLDRLFHYKVYIFPTVNYISKTPTSIHHEGHDYDFDGFSIFSHCKLEKLPSCQVMRFNILYTLIGREEKPCQNFTVRSLDMVTDYIFVELLEMLDLKWRADGADGGCRLFHLMPRFVRPLTSNGKRVEILSMDAILSYLIESAKPVFSDNDLTFFEQLDDRVWRKAIDDVRGSLVTCPGKKPAAIRVDQIDRRSLTDSSIGMFRGNRYPMVVHISYIPVKLSLSRDPTYKRTMRNFFRMQYAMMNKVKVTQEDKTRLNVLADKLDDFENNRAQHRELTVEISSENLIQTGIRPDVSQHALIVLCFISHMRFHRGLNTLEKRVNYHFKDKKLLHQALTHPSYRRTIFGTNQDHVQNSMLNCGFRYIDYGDRAKLFKEWRKRGLTYMIKVMSLMPSEIPVRSAIYGNERLEFLGDAVIEIISSVHLFYTFPNMSEGHLDAYRQALVQNHHLSKLAMRLGLHNHLLYAHGVDFCLDSTFTHAWSDAFEAFMAAVYLDGGLNEVDRIFASVLWCDDKDVLKVWCCPPPHVLQIQEPNGDRHWLDKGDLLKNLTNLEERLGIKYRHIRLLAKSLTLRQTGYNNYTYGDNQRLEFLGDSLLKFVTSDFLFNHFPQHHEGHLSLLKNSLVNKYTQSLVCSDLGLHEFIIKSTGNKYPTTDKYRADILEAFVGSLFVDKDLNWVERFCEVCFWPRLVGFILKQDWNDPKSKLQQCCLTLRDLDEEPEIAQYRILDFTGPTNQRKYRVGVYFKGKRLANGTGRTVQQAQMDAARNALVQHHKYFPQLDFQKSIIQRKYGEVTAAGDCAAVTRRSRFDSDDHEQPRHSFNNEDDSRDKEPSSSPPKRRRRRYISNDRHQPQQAVIIDSDSKKKDSSTSPPKRRLRKEVKKDGSPSKARRKRFPSSTSHSHRARSPSQRHSSGSPTREKSPICTGTLADLLLKRKKKSAE